MAELQTANGLVVGMIPETLKDKQDKEPETVKRTVRKTADK